MARVFIGLFDTAAAAQHALHGIRHMGVPAEDIFIFDAESASEEVIARIMDTLVGTGLSEDQARSYLARLERGQTIVAVTTDDFTAETAYDTFRYHGMLDVNQQVTRERIAEREKEEATTGEDPRFTPSETVGPSVGQKWQESNKLLTATGTAVGAAHGAAIGGLIAGPAGIAAGAAIGAAVGGGAGALADATFESVKQEDAVRQENAAHQEEAEQREEQE